MIFKFPKKKIVLECFTHHAAVHKFFPITRAKHHLPKWFKKIPQTQTAVDDNGVEFPQATFRRCDGFTHLFNTGWVLPMWCDMVIETDEDGAWRYHVSDSVHDAVRGHATPAMWSHAGQLGNEFPTYSHIKLNVPWIIREKTGVNFHFSQNTWGIKEHWDYLTVVPGLINYKDQSAAHINMFLKRDIKIIIEHNTPLVHCIPLSDAKLEIKNYLVSEQEYRHLHQSNSFMFSFLGRYKKMLQMTK